MDTSGIEPDTFRKVNEVRSERDKPTTPCAPVDSGHPNAIWSLLYHVASAIFDVTDLKLCLVFRGAGSEEIALASDELVAAISGTSQRNECTFQLMAPGPEINKT